jgi:hypothetical protein
VEEEKELRLWFRMGIHIKIILVGPNSTSLSGLRDFALPKAA